MSKFVKACEISVAVHIKVAGVPGARYRFGLLIYNSKVLFALKAQEPPRINPVKLACQVKRGLLLFAGYKLCTKYST